MLVMLLIVLVNESCAWLFAAMGTVPEGQSIDEGMDEEMDDVHQPPEDEELRRAACERDVRESQRSFKHVVPKPGEDSKDWIVVDTRQLGRRTKASKEARQLLVDQALATKDQDNERFTRKLRARFDRFHLPRYARLLNLSQSLPI